MKIEYAPCDAINVDVLVCTFRRPSVIDTIRSIDAQTLSPRVSLRIIVADNDDKPTAEKAIDAISSEISTPLVYIHAPSGNISIARNACLDSANGDFVAFLDDDEVAAPDWLEALLERAQCGGCDGVFGPVVASYGEDTPAWIRQYDYLSTYPQTRGGKVETGYTGNALLRWMGAPYRHQRFSLDKGKTGGEDTEFFFRLSQAGARLGVATDALVYEAVDPARLQYRWLRQRKMRAGRTYGRCAVLKGSHAPIGVCAAAVLKIATCAVMSGISGFSKPTRRYWLLRGYFHWGVFTGLFGAKESATYGG